MLVSLRENGIGPEGATAIANGLKFNAFLTYLDLGANSIGSEGLHALAETVMMSEITHLLLSRNNIGDSGASAIAGLIMGARKLQTLDLSFNRITSSGGKLIGDALRENG